MLINKEKESIDLTDLISDRYRYGLLGIARTPGGNRMVWNRTQARKGEFHERPIGMDRVTLAQDSEHLLCKFPASFPGSTETS